MKPPRSPRICVYCASRLGDDPTFEQSARDVGKVFANKGIDLVFGGGQVGLMGVIADTALSGGRHVIGVIPRNLMDKEVGHEGLSELRIVENMAERKRTMFDEGDAFLTLPGGVGTMEELFEVLCWAYLGLHSKPIGLLNVDGYYDELISFLDRSVERGMTNPRARQLLRVDDDPEVLVEALLSMIGGKGIKVTT
ncbi:MAG TPA: TIGR00730 family Rossman fold protein [Microthrixaceae bacterium]|nr:TIGR00730 family Rossman fold protein [Microthrixaceae bacterium]